jgi:predicted metalloprotease
MRWKRNTGFDQIEDRRGQGGGGLGGMLGGGGGGLPIPIPGGRAGGGIGGLIVAVVLFLIFSGVLGGGGNGGLGGLGGLSGGGAAQPGGTLNPQSDTDQFVAYVVSDIQEFWAQTFAASGKDYPETKLVLFDEAGTTSACGPASAATGPFYCPADQKVYLELGFFDVLESRFGAQGGDFAIAYVIAHEFGHHIQTVTGISQSVQEQGAADAGRRNDLSVRQELQADCLAGVWAHSAASDVQPGDIEEALSAASAVGDDRIQQATQGRVDPESWTHGSAEQRVEWFTRGWQSGDPATCDTFA